MKNKPDFSLEKWRILEKSCTILFKVSYYENYKIHTITLYISGSTTLNVLLRNSLEIFYKHILKHCRKICYLINSFQWETAPLENVQVLLLFCFTFLLSELSNSNIIDIWQSNKVITEAVIYLYEKGLRFSFSLFLEVGYYYICFAVELVGRIKHSTAIE